MLSLKERLTEILIKNKLLTEEQLNQALEIQKEKGGRLSDIITALKFIREEELVSVLSQGLGFPLIDLKRFKIDPEIAKIIPADIARHYQIIPISKMGSTVTLAMADPLNIFAIDHVGALTGYKINPIIASASDIMGTIELSYPDATPGVIENLVREISETSLELIKEEKEALPSDQELTRISKEAPVIKVTNRILEDAVKRKSSDILIEPWERSLRVRYRVDGLLYDQPAPPPQLAAALTSRLKVMARLDIAEKRLPQDGMARVRVGEREIDVRVSTVPVADG